MTLEWHRIFEFLTMHLAHNVEKGFVYFEYLICFTNILYVNRKH